MWLAMLNLILAGVFIYSAGYFANRYSQDLGTIIVCVFFALYFLCQSVLVQVEKFKGMGG